MPLLNQPGKCSPHRDNIVVRVRTENQDAFRIGSGSFRAGRIVGIGFTAGPSGNGVLQIIEYLDVYFVRRAKSLNQVAHAVVHVVFVFDFQNRFVYFLT